MIRKLSKLEIAVLRAFGRLRVGSFWVKLGHVAWRVPGSKRCGICREHGVHQSRCRHPVVPVRDAESLKAEMDACMLDFSIMHVGSAWHAIVAPHGELLKATTGGYSMASTEAKALMLALVEADRRYRISRGRR